MAGRVPSRPPVIPTTALVEMELDGVAIDLPWASASWNPGTNTSSLKGRAFCLLR